MRNLLIPIGFFFIAIFGFFWYIQPTYGEIKSVRADIQQYDDALNRIGELQEIRDNLLATYNSIEGQELTFLNKMVPDNVDTVRILLEVDEVAANHGLSVRQVEFSRPNQNTGQQATNNSLRSLEMSFNTIGSYPDVTAFIRDLERSVRLLDLRNLELSQNNDGSGNSYSVTLETHWLPANNNDSN